MSDVNVGNIIGSGKLFGHKISFSFFVDKFHYFDYLIDKQVLMNSKINICAA